MEYYVVKSGSVVSAIETKGKWESFRTPVRKYATPLAHRHALAFAHIVKNGQILNEQQFLKYKLQGEK